MSDAGGLQLLPETRKKIEIKVPGQNQPLVLGASFLVIILVFYFAIVTFKNSTISSISNVDAKLTDLDNSRDKNSENEIINLQQQLSVVNPLLKAHLIWSDAFLRMQKLIQPQIKFQSFNTDTSTREFAFAAVAPNYTVVARQIASFYSDDSLRDIVLRKVSSVQTGGVEFSMQLVFDTNKFLMQSAR